MSAIIFKNLSKIYQKNGTSFEALKDITLTINKGEFFGLLGPTGSESLINGLRAVKNSFNSYPVDTLASLAAISATHDELWFEKNIDTIIKTRSYFSQELKKIGFRVLPSSANFVLITHPSLEAEALNDHLFKNKILVRHFPESSVSNWLRVTIGKRKDCEVLLSILKQKISGAN